MHADITGLCDVVAAHAVPGDGIALSGIGASVTYAQLDARIQAALGALAALGLRPGERVLLLLPTSVEFVTAYFAAHRAGLVVMPLNPLLGPDEVRHILDSMRPAAIIAAPADGPYPVLSALDGLVADLRLSCLVLRSGPDQPFDRAMARARTDLPPVRRDGSDEALILFTSGTSGRPKGASHREAALITNARHANAVFSITHDDVLLCPLPLSHVFGQMVMMLGGLSAGAELSLVPRPGPAALFDAMVQRRPSIIAAVPASLAAVAEQARQTGHRREPGRLRFVLAGGAPLPAPTGTVFQNTFGVPVHQGYGMTEVACCIALEQPGTMPTGGVGALCTPLSHRILPLDPADPDQGELQLAGPNLLRGYYIDGTFQPRGDDEWFATGDIVRRDAEGTLFLCDRKKEMIIRNGYNVYPSEVEAALASHPGVLHVAVIGVADEQVGQEVAAYVSPREGHVLSADELAAWCRARIALYKYPRLIAILPALPTNTTGKIMKRALDTAILRRVSLSG
jgi:long-chain acyl-CoA synthetase